MTARVTIVMVPRERFGRTILALDAIAANTTIPYDLVVVDARTPGAVGRELRRRAASGAFSLLPMPRTTPPNTARQHALDRIKTELVCFVDNDVLPDPGWLAELVRCLDETDAVAVGPLYLEGPPDGRVVHMAGGWWSWVDTEHGRMLETDHRHQGLPEGRVAQELRREPCDFLEFHTMLARTEALRAIGGMDESLTATREHLDVSRRLTDAGGALWVEPASRVLYVDPPPIDLRDVPYFLRRWSTRRTRASLESFIATNGLSDRYLERMHIYQGRRLSVLRHALGRVLQPVLGEPQAGRAAAVASRVGKRVLGISRG